jgi:hypothetical protein
VDTGPFSNGALLFRGVRSCLRPWCAPVLVDFVEILAFCFKHRVCVLAEFGHGADAAGVFVYVNVVIDTDDIVRIPTIKVNEEDVVEDLYIGGPSPLRKSASRTQVVDPVQDHGHVVSHVHETNAPKLVVNVVELDSHQVSAFGKVEQLLL